MTNFLTRHDAEFSLPARIAARAHAAHCCDYCETPVAVGSALPAIVGSSAYALCEPCRETFDADPWAFQDAIIDESIASMDGTPTIPCPRPRLVAGEYNGLYRDAASQGLRGMIDAWEGFTAAGYVMAAGVDFGKFWRLDDPRPILASAVVG